MNKSSRRSTVAVLVAAVIIMLVWSAGTSARMEFGNLEISGEVFILAEGQWNSGKGDGPSEFSLNPGVPGLFLDPSQIGPPPSNGTPNRDRFNHLTAFRTEVLIEAVYRGIPHVTPVLKLRPFYDAMFDINGKNKSISKYWETNFRNNMQEDSDPLVREAYLDLAFHPLFIRAGRQIATWGRSDGVTVLDVVTPRNFRNPLTFEQERFMIPQWMINMRLDLTRQEWLPGGIQKELQIIWNLDYKPASFPGFHQEEEGQHPWTLAVVEFANQVINVSDTLYPAVFGSAPGDDGPFFDGDEWDDGNAIDKSEVFVRWRAKTGDDVGPLSDMTYSIHYAYLFEDIPFYELHNRLDFGFAFPFAGPRDGVPGVPNSFGGIDFDRHRYQLVGFSFDKALMWLPGQFKGTVMRGELAYNIGNQYYEPDLGLVETNQLQTLIGLDQYLYIGPHGLFKTPWFTSFQWWRDEILRDPGPGKLTRLTFASCSYQPHCGREGYIIGGASNAFNGLRQRTRDVLTLFMFNDFLPGKTLRVEFFGLYEFGGWQNSGWMRGVVGYSINNRLSTRVGINVLQGRKDAFFGEFKQVSSAFMEVKFTF